MCLDYEQWEWMVVPGTVIYCDPPYAGTPAYQNVPLWDSDRFWSVVSEWSYKTTVFVSEYEAPPGWDVVWEQMVRVQLNQNQGKTATERLFMKGPK